MKRAKCEENATAATPSSPLAAVAKKEPQNNPSGAVAAENRPAAANAEAVLVDKLATVQRMSKLADTHAEACAMAALCRALRIAARAPEPRPPSLSDPATWQLAVHLFCEQRCPVHAEAAAELCVPLAAAFHTISGERATAGSQRELARALTQILAELTEERHAQLKLPWAGASEIIVAAIAAAARLPCEETVAAVRQALLVLRSVALSSSSSRGEVIAAMRVLVPLLGAVGQQQQTAAAVALRAAAQTALHTTFVVPICRAALAADPTKKAKKEKGLVLEMLQARVTEELQGPSPDAVVGLGELFADIARTVDTEIALTPQGESDSSENVVSARSVKSELFQRLLEIPLECLKQPGSKEQKLAVLQLASALLSAAASADFLGMTATEEEIALCDTLASAASVFVSTAFDATTYDAAASVATQLMRLHSISIEPALPDIIRKLWSTQWDTTQPPPSDMLLVETVNTFSKLRMTDTKLLDTLLTALAAAESFGSFFVSYGFFRKCVLIHIIFFPQPTPLTHTP